MDVNCRRCFYSARGIDLDAATFIRGMGYWNPARNKITIYKYYYAYGGVE